MANYIGRSRVGQPLAGPSGLLIQVNNAPDNLTAFNYQGILYDLTQDSELLDNPLVITRVDISHLTPYVTAGISGRYRSETDPPRTEYTLSIQRPTISDDYRQQLITHAQYLRISVLDRNTGQTHGQRQQLASDPVLTISTEGDSLHLDLRWLVNGQQLRKTQSYIHPTQNAQGLLEHFLAEAEHYAQQNMPRTTFDQRLLEQRRHQLAEEDRRRVERLRNTAPNPAAIRESAAIQNRVASADQVAPESEIPAVRDVAPVATPRAGRTILSYSDDYLWHFEDTQLSAHQEQMRIRDLERAARQREHMEEFRRMFNDRPARFVPPTPVTEVNDSQDGMETHTLREDGVHLNGRNIWTSGLRSAMQYYDEAGIIFHNPEQDALPKAPVLLPEMSVEQAQEELEEEETDNWLGNTPF